jgi:CheY-like chemotaxis protein
VINTGQEGLDMIRAEKFDLILLDLAMPEFSGYDVIKTETRHSNRIKKYCYLYCFVKSRPSERNRISGVKEIFKNRFLWMIDKIDRKVPS